MPSDAAHERATPARAEAEELRLALVLNGGVSLAVWMGGVALEIDRLAKAVRGGDTPYDALLTATASTAVVDVIAGTSAGGINGAALALAQVNTKADIGQLREVWSTQGQIDVLLREPFRGKPSSLLRGDDYFLPELHRAMHMLATPFEARPGAKIDVTLTTTLLKGWQDVTVDDFGELIPQTINTGRFHFTNQNGADGDHHRDDFAAERIETTATALGLAARATAGFPFAFEPTFVPVHEAAAPGVDDKHRVDMSRYASWADQRKGVDADAREDRSRYAVDGGVLANTPVQHVLDVIDRRQAAGPVRRALVLVFPHAPQPVASIDPDKRSDPPTATGALAGVVGSILAHSSRSYIENIESHNRRAGDWRGSQEQILTAFREQDGAPAAAARSAGLEGRQAVRRLYATLQPAWQQYRHERMRHAARSLARKVDAREQWTYERIRRGAEAAQRAWPEPDLPYAPARFQWDSPTWQNTYLRNGPWRWGDTPAVGVVESVAAVLRSALGVVNPDRPEDATRIARLSDAREKVGRSSREIVRLRRDEIDAAWVENPYLRALEPSEDYWTARIVSYARAMGHEAPGTDARLRDLLRRCEPAEDSRSAAATTGARDDGRDDARTDALDELRGRAVVGATVRENVMEAIGALIAVKEDLRALSEAVRASTPRGTAPASDLPAWCDFVYAARLHREPTAEPARILLRLLALDAGTRLMSRGTTTGSNLPVRLAELSLRVEHPWAHYSRTPGDKAAGLDLARFGGFLKRSWRINDWIWGRLDAVTMLCQIVLDPDRLRRLQTLSGQTPEDFADTTFTSLRASLFGDTDAAGIPGLEAIETAARAEWVEALTAPRAIKQHLPAVARWAALPQQVDVILEELPVLVAAIGIDRVDGAAARTRGTRFAAELDSGEFLAEVAAAAASPAKEARLRTGWRALELFDRAGIGREDFHEEVGSDAMLRAGASALGTLATVVDTDIGRVPAAKPVTSAFRGAMMLPYWLIRGLTGGGAVAKFLATGALVVGGMVLALSLFGVLGGASATAGVVGGAVVLAAFAYAALKSGSLLHPVALLAPVGPLLAYALASGSTDAKDAGSRVLVILAAVAALYLLGTIPWPLRSPLKELGTGWLRFRAVLSSRWPLFVVTAAVSIGVLVAVVLWWQDAWTGIRAVASWLAEQPWWVQSLIAAGVVVVGSLVAYRRGVVLRQWRVPVAKAVTARAEAPDVIEGDFVEDDLENPSGVAANWAPVYGAGYLLVGILFVHLWPTGTQDGTPAWVRFTEWWLVVVGVLLCLLAPLVVARGVHQGVQARMEATWRLEATLAGASRSEMTRAQVLLDNLVRADQAYRYLVRSAAPGHAGTDAGALRLTRKGSALLAELERRSGEALRSTIKGAPTR
ncbi:Patatin [Xylanimonas cellulosilytica DSM 15894]|uniref:Patatin n=1 Tax=Xylanimonas cellulosilytica (strain DSM 15894 / JCM 12276 / CECT 5975 / KCTC 9989 / LMG 20990 / NBRC 107835 / XIL07) TaxID=446471 RepID=D1BXZ9_XYLCX|nr:patatin-like protein [Xylanimonas cellulosilytica]ACZ31790.1 Patatin [Xylanimonas cellulosilytica DSM 15894]